MVETNSHLEAWEKFKKESGAGFDESPALDQLVYLTFLSGRQSMARDAAEWHRHNTASIQITADTFNEGIPEENSMWAGEQKAHNISAAHFAALAEDAEKEC